MEVIYYHEDFYRQIELVAEENYFSSERFINNLPPKKGSKNGIYNISTRSEQKVRLLDRNIPMDGIRKILDPISSLYSEEVKTGYGSSSSKADNTVVWGFEQYGIFIKHSNGNAVAIWISHSPLFIRDRVGKDLCTALFKLIEYYYLILIDWNKELICAPSNEDDVKDYLVNNLAFDW